jgi:hypothetical protein
MSYFQYIGLVHTPQSPPTFTSWFSQNRQKIPEVDCIYNYYAIYIRSLRIRIHYVLPWIPFPAYCSIIPNSLVLLFSFFVIVIYRIGVENPVQALVQYSGVVWVLLIRNQKKGG